MWTTRAMTSSSRTDSGWPNAQPEGVNALCTNSLSLIGSGTLSKVVIPRTVPGFKRAYSTSSIRYTPAATFSPRATHSYPLLSSPLTPPNRTFTHTSSPGSSHLPSTS